MPIPEPPDTLGLWSAVKARSGWVETNEDTVRELAAVWRRVGESFTAASTYETKDVRTAWRDEPGALFAGHLENERNTARRVGLSCEQQSNHVNAFAQIVENTKRRINTIIELALPGYAALHLPAILPFLARGRYVDMVAGKVTGAINEAKTQVEYLDSGVTVQDTSGDRAPFGEYHDIAGFITGEMNTNGDSERVQRIAELLRSPNPLDKAKGLKAWYDLVKTDGPWDHKDRMHEMTVGDNIFTPMPGAPAEIRDDIWSNIHYGYVGSQAGIDPRVLHAGANGVDIIEHFGKTDPGDQAAVQIGIDLARKYPPGTLTTDALNAEILANHDRLSAGGVIRPR
jgi:hypothetical protein